MIRLMSYHDYQYLIFEHDVKKIPIYKIDNIII